MELETIIGLEIHAQIASKTKMFCSCSAQYFGMEANLNMCPVCTGFPGQLPVVNEMAVSQGIKAALALGCEISKYSQFDRKNYFYPDLPKGYQISQLDYPIGLNGKIKIKVEGGAKEINIVRLHIEEDAGKLIHVNGGTLIDFNRCGVGLMEIVSAPDLRSAQEAVLYAKQMQNILRYAGASDADMEKGMMRFDASVSLRPIGENKLYPRAEIKNLNSYKSLEIAIKYEVQRQKELWEAGKAPEKDTTVGYDDTTFRTYFLREKEAADDYRYFSEPDLPPLEIGEDMVLKFKEEIGELPQEKYERYVGELGLREAEALFLVEDRELSVFFDEVVKKSGDVKKSATLVLSVLVGLMKKEGIKIGEVKFGSEEMADLILLVNEGKVGLNNAKTEVLEEMFLNGGKPNEVIEKLGVGGGVQEGELIELVKMIVLKNEKSVEDYKKGKQQALQFLIGQCMKETKGKADAVKVKEMILAILG